MPPGGTRVIDHLDAGARSDRGGVAPGRPDDPLFVLDGVDFALDGAAILDRVDLSLEEGVLTAVTGASGAGKSTLLRLLNRLEVPTAGTIHFRGRPLASLDPVEHRRRAELVFQRPVVFGGSCADNLRVADPSADHSALAHVLSRVGLDEGVLSRAADSLSGGEAQRLCIARALLTRPEVLLMDEPTSALDDVSTEAVERLARRFAAHGGSVIWVSHDGPQVERIADRIVHLRGGRVAHEAPRSPTTPVVDDGG